MLRTIHFAIIGLFFLGLLLVSPFPHALAQEKLSISGYGNIHYMDHNGTARMVGEKDLDDGFIQLREFSLFMDFLISDRVIASTELEVGDSGNLYTANYAYVDVQATETLSFRAGKILVPFLSYNENKPNFKQHLMSQPFTAWNIAPVIGAPLEIHGFGWSDAGVVVNWMQSIGDAGILDLKASMINGLGSDTAALDSNTIQLDTGAQPVVRPRDGLLGNEENNELRDNNGDKASTVKLSFKTSDWPLDLGVSWYRGAWDPDSERDLQMIGAHFNWLSRFWTLRGEYVKVEVEQEAGFDPVTDAGMTGPAGLNTTTGDYGMNAWYVEASIVPLRYASNRYLRLVARYDEVDTNDKASFTPFDRSRMTFGTEWQFETNTRLRYEFQRSKIHDFQNAPGPFVAAGGEETIDMSMVSIIFSF